MKVIQYHAIGGPEVLKYEDAPTPEPSPDQVLIKVAALGVNFVDASRRNGHAPLPPGSSFPIIPGGECAGVVEAVGNDVTAFKQGDRVFSRSAAPGYAEYTIVNADGVFQVPSSLSMVEAATIGTAFGTAWHAVVDRAQVKPGETVLVHACASGVAIAVVQVAKHMGATVIGTASTDEKLQWAKGYGVDYGINYESQDFVEEVMRLTDGKRVAVVIDGVGGDVFLRSLRCLQPYGRMVFYGVSGGNRSAEMVLPEVWGLNLNILGSGGGVSREQAEKMFSKFEDGTFRATVDRTWPLAEAAEAHRYLEERRVRGKVALTVG